MPNGPVPADLKVLRRAIGAVSAILALGSLAFSAFGFAEKFDVKPRCVAVGQALVLAGWIVFPPVWFWAEYYFVYRKGHYPGEGLEEFKYGQDQAAKIWLALITGLFGLYFGKDLIK